MSSPKRQLALDFGSPNAAGSGDENGAATEAPTAHRCEVLDDAIVAAGNTRRDGTSLAKRLSALTQRSVSVVVTDNRRAMISATRDDKTLKLRLHHMFVDADDAVVRALADYSMKGRAAKAGAVLDAFIAKNRDSIRKGPRTVRTMGEHHDLTPLFEELNRTYFSQQVEAGITWGRHNKRRRKRSIRLGSYSHSSELIRVHPKLDQAWVPRWFVRYVVFHEMLHAALPPVHVGGKLIHHPPEFHARERLYPDFARAVAWERKHISRLLR